MQPRANQPDLSRDSLRALVVCVRSSAVQCQAAGAAAPAPFVTISRQCGAGGITLADQLVERLGVLHGRSPHPWSQWDRERVEKVASDHHISRELIDAVTETGRSWFDRLAADLATAVDRGPDEMVVHHRVSSTVRALAEAGYVVIVGRGGMPLTRDMPGGLHLRLVARFEHRVREIARRRGLSEREAQEYVRSVDHGREAFYRRYFPGVTTDATNFSITFNTAAVTEEQVIQGVISMLVELGPLHAARQSETVVQGSGHGPLKT